MSVVWHRLGREHPLVKQLDRVSRRQCVNLSRRYRLHHAQDIDKEAIGELEAERVELADRRAALEDAAREALAKRGSSTAAAVARSHLEAVLAQRHQKRPSCRDASIG